MRALEIGHMQGLASQAEFTHNLDMVVEMAELAVVAGFAARRQEYGHWLDISDVQYDGNPQNQGRTLELVPEDFLEDVGVYVVGRPLPKGTAQRFRPTSPSVSDIEAFCTLREHNPKVISGIAVPGAVGRVSLFLFRQSDQKAFDEAAARELPTEFTTWPALDGALTDAGLNWTWLRYGDTSPFAGEVDFLFG